MNSSSLFVLTIIFGFVVWGVWGILDFVRRKFRKNDPNMTLFQVVTKQARNDRVNSRTKDPFDPWDSGRPF